LDGVRLPGGHLIRIDERKEAKPAGSAIEMAAKMGIEISTEQQHPRTDPTNLAITLSNIR
jgi:hypothetical protein